MKIYKPVKCPTKVKGYWKDERGKVHFDNIQIIEAKTQGEFDIIVKNLFQLGEQAIFYKGIDKAYILEKDGRRTTLENKIERERKNLKAKEFHRWIDYYGGVTIHSREDSLLVEIWSQY